METEWLIGSIYVSRDSRLIFDTLAKYNLDISELERYLSRFARNRNIDITINQDLIVVELGKELARLDRYMEENLRQPSETSPRKVADYTIKTVYRLVQKQGTQVAYDALDELGYTEEDIAISTIDLAELKEYAIEVLENNPKEIYRRAESAKNALRVLSGEKVSKQMLYKLKHNIQGTLEIPDSDEPPDEPSIFELDSRR